MYFEEFQQFIDLIIDQIYWLNFVLIAGIIVSAIIIAKLYIELGKLDAKVNGLIDVVAEQNKYIEMNNRN